MLAASVVLIGVLLPVCSFAPGFFLVRRLPWNPSEKLCAAVGLSLILLYLAALGLFWAGQAHLLQGPAGYGVVSLACFALGALAARDALRLAAAASVRRVVLGFAALLIWTLALLGMIRNYSGGGWYGDWLEHFQRTLFFLHHLPKDVRFLGLSPLPARPPLMNLVASFFLAQAGDRFELFQITFAFLNLLVFLPCGLLLPALAGRRRVLPLLALFAFNPVLTQNATYTWTKLLAAFYVLLGIAFYLRGSAKRDRRRMVVAFTALAAAMLVHYSAGPFAVFLALHYLLFSFRRRPNRGRELAAIGAAGGILLATWFGWSIATYGAGATLTSNPSLQSLDNSGHGVVKMAGNLADTVVPHPLRRDARMELFRQPSAAGWLRDCCFLIYQTNLIAGMGLAGGLVALYWFGRLCRRGFAGRAASERGFWLMLVPFCLLLGVAVMGERDTFGQAHLTLQPLILLGVTLVAARFARLPRAAACLVLLGCTLDFGLGVLLQARVQRAEDAAARGVYSSYARDNWLLKHWYATRGTDPDARRRDDQRDWGGWFQKHGGSVTFLGDHVSAWSKGGLGAAEAVVGVMFAVLMAGLARAALPGRRPRAAAEAA
jgi:hypothetical protein